MASTLDGGLNLPRLLYLVTEDWYFCSHRMQLAEAAARNGYEVWVVTNDTGQAKNITAKGFTFIPLKLPRSLGSPWQELRTLIRLVWIYRRLRPDIIHHVALKPVISGSIAAWLCRMPCVINAYTGLGYMFISHTPMSRFFVTIVVPLMSRILAGSRFHSIVQNRDDRELLLRLGMVDNNRLELIRGSGVDTGVFRYSPEMVTDQPLVLFASRLLRDKGIDEFVDAAASLIARGVHARFIVVGDPDPANPTSISAARVEEWHRQGIIEWWGRRENMAEVFRQVHIVCLPSYREGLPKVLLEAAACGRAIVTTDVPGCRDVVIDGVSGLLVPVRDSRLLADAIYRLLESADLRKRMGEAATRHIHSNFAADIVNTETLKLYNKLASSMTGGPGNDK